MTSHGDFYTSNTIQTQSQRLAAARARRDRRVVVAFAVALVLVLGGVFAVMAWTSARSAQQQRVDYGACMALARSDAERAAC